VGKGTPVGWTEKREREREKREREREKREKSGRVSQV
jgi:hypothetical protein